MIIKGIPLHDWEVRALLQGSVRVWRPVRFKRNPWINPLPHVEYARDGMPIWWSGPPTQAVRDSDYYDNGYPCPLGAVGETRFVRETWGPSKKSGMRQVAYAADGRWVSLSADGTVFPQGYITGVTDKQFPDWSLRSGHWVGRGYFAKWQACNTMPKSATRLWVRINSVRVERLSSVTDADLPTNMNGDRGKGCQCGPCSREDFLRDWHKRYGRKFPAAGDPWLWSVELTKCEMPEGEK